MLQLFRMLCLKFVVCYIFFPRIAIVVKNATVVCNIFLKYCSYLKCNNILNMLYLLSVWFLVWKKFSKKFQYKCIFATLWQKIISLNFVYGCIFPSLYYYAKVFLGCYWRIFDFCTPFQCSEAYLEILYLLLCDRIPEEEFKKGSKTNPQLKTRLNKFREQMDSVNNSEDEWIAIRPEWTTVDRVLASRY